MMTVLQISGRNLPFSQKGFGKLRPFLGACRQKYVSGPVEKWGQLMRNLSGTLSSTKIQKRKTRV